MTSLPQRAALLLVLGLTVASWSLATAPVSEAATGSIRGTVYAPVSVEEVEVCIVEPRPSETCTYPKPDGTYELVHLLSGPYKVEFLPSYRSGLVPQYYDHKARLDEADTVVVNPEQVTLNVDADLEIGGVIEGTVTAAVGGSPLEDVEVCALEATSGASAGCTRTDAGGGYRLQSLPSGSYRVGFWGKRRSAAYAPRFYAGARTFFDATPVAVSTGSTSGGIDAQMSLGASIAGAVTDLSTGLPLAGIGVCVLSTVAQGPERCVSSDVDGGYAFPGLATGSYDVVFSPEFGEFSSEEFLLPADDGYRTQYYDQAESRAAATSLALTEPASRTGVDAKLLSSRPTPVVSTPPIEPIRAAEPPATVAPPQGRRRKRCKRGFAPRKEKGVRRCVRLHRRKKHHRPRHRAHDKQGASSHR